jgi:hypothetical protein
MQSFSEENQCTWSRNNATPLTINDDGTTRIINVSYSEKIVTAPHQYDRRRHNHCISISTSITFNSSTFFGSSAAAVGYCTENIFAPARNMARGSIYVEKRDEIVQKEFLENARYECRK